MVGIIFVKKGKPFIGRNQMVIWLRYRSDRALSIGGRSRELVRNAG